MLRAWLALDRARLLECGHRAVVARRARKEPGKYVEGVVLADNLQALFRNVPPPLSLALAMTEKHEKAERAEIMRERGCSELEAVHVVAERIAAKRGG